MPLPSISLLRCFQAAAKYESYADAAHELGMTVGGVSRQVKALEEYIGTKLFKRDGRGIKLTLAGEALAPQIKNDLLRLQQTVEDARALGQRPGILRIAAPPTFSERWLVPRLKDFLKENPEVALSVKSKSEPFDLAAEKVDVAIHYGMRDWPGASLAHLCPENLLLVGAPAITARLKERSATEVATLDKLHLNSRPFLWENFSEAHSLDKHPFRQGIYFDQFNLIISAAISGLGVAIIPSYMIENEIRDGVLDILFDVANRDEGTSYYVATPQGQGAPLTEKFSRWIQLQVGKPASPP